MVLLLQARELVYVAAGGLQRGEGASSLDQGRCGCQVTGQRRVPDHGALEFVDRFNGASLAHRSGAQQAAPALRDVGF